MSINVNLKEYFEIDSLFKKINMNVLFTSEEVVDVCLDGHYYSRNLPQHIKKYSYFGNVSCACYSKEVESSSYSVCDKNSAKYLFFHKENSIKAIKTYRRSNKEKMDDIVAKADLLIAHVPSGLSRYAIKAAKKENIQRKFYILNIASSAELFPAGPFMATYYATKAYNIPYFIVVVGCPWDSLFNYDWRGKLLAPTAFIKQRLIVSKAPYALYVTREFLQKRYPCSGIVENASNVCINQTPEDILMKRLERISKYKKGDMLKIATSASVDVRYKGQQYVIKAIKILNKLYNFNIHYYIIGGGDQSYLRSIVKKNGLEEYIHFVGALKPAEVISTLDEMDLYIQPSKQEGLPRALIEAMSRALPSFGSSIAGIPELLPFSCLFKKGNVGEIVKVIKNALNVDTLQNLAKSNFQASKEYTLDVINARRNAFFDKVISDYNLNAKE